MSTTLTTAMINEQNSTRTNNGAKAFRGSLNSNLDLFFNGGAMRSKSEKEIIDIFSKAYGEDKQTAMKILGLIRSARFGMGEKRFTQTLIPYLADKGESIEKLTYLAKELGYWKDLFTLFGTKHESKLLDVIKEHLLVKKDGLLSKYLDRQGEQASKVRKHLKIQTPKEYRKLLVGLTKVVEQQMASGDWANIKYESVPSKAMSTYSKSFAKHDTTRFNDFIEEAKKGNTKINSSVLYPYELVRKVRSDKNTAIAQWNQLPDFIGDDKTNFLVVADTSGSMRGSKTPQPYDVSTSLAIYLSEKSKGVFKDVFITFSEKPQIQKLSGDLYDKVNQFREINASNTNLESVFDLILNTATQNKLNQSDLPNYVCILSDFQFDRACTNSNHTAFEMIKEKYRVSGYEMPMLIFWNLNASGNSTPVTFNQDGVALVSGFSPSIMKSVLSGKMNPIDMMMDAINKPIYEPLGKY